MRDDLNWRMSSSDGGAGTQCVEVADGGRYLWDAQDRSL